MLEMLFCFPFWVLNNVLTPSCIVKHWLVNLLLQLEQTQKKSIFMQNLINSYKTSKLTKVSIIIGR